MSKIGLIIIFFTTYVFAQTQTGSTGGCCGGTTTASVTRDKHNKIISIQDEKHQFLNLNEVGKYQKVDDKVSDLLQYASKTLNINFKNVSQLYNFYVFEF